MSTSHLEALAAREPAPMNPKGRDLRMTLEIRATTPFDDVLSTVIEAAVREHSEGEMVIGKRTRVTRGESTVELTMTAYAQTWDGEP